MMSQESGRTAQTVLHQINTTGVDKLLGRDVDSIGGASLPERVNMRTRSAQVSLRPTTPRIGSTRSPYRRPGGYILALSAPDTRLKHGSLSLTAEKRPFPLRHFGEAMCWECQACQVSHGTDTACFNTAVEQRGLIATLVAVTGKCTHLPTA
jgi:hypothetical protein